MFSKYLILIVFFIKLCQSRSRLFSVDYANGKFLLDGQPFVYHSGEMHYFRTPHQRWKDRLDKMAYAGLNAVTTYVAWNIHELRPGYFDYSGQSDLFKFIETAKQSGLLVILRPGPYICAEWDFGGFPAWLLSDNITFLTRRSDPKYLDAVDRYYENLLPRIKPLLYHNGGPVIMVQIENEYGSTGICDREYMNHLVTLHRQLLDDVIVLFTCDQSHRLVIDCGRINGTLTTVNFGPTKDVASEFKYISSLFPNNPLTVTELYAGWFDSWGKPHQTKSTEQLIDTLQQLNNLNASWNLYMFEGGTNFGYMSGLTVPQQKITTSYDYDAPLTEAGDMTPKYEAIKLFLNETVSTPPPTNSTKASYGLLNMRELGNYLDLLPLISEQPIRTERPLNMEQANQLYGFILYRHIFDRDFSLSELQVPGIRDRGYVSINGIPVGIVETAVSTTLEITAEKNQTLDILVENWGRFNWGPEIDHNRKGIINDVYVGSTVLLDWQMIPINVTKIFGAIRNSGIGDVEKLITRKVPQMNKLPSLYHGSFYPPMTVGTQNTFLNTCGWTRGQAFVNGNNLGRYRPTKGPQLTLYTPFSVLLVGVQNDIIFFELEPPVTDGNASIEFTDQPSLSGRCPEATKRKIL